MVTGTIFNAIEDKNLKLIFYISNLIPKYFGNNNFEIMQIDLLKPSLAFKETHLSNVLRRWGSFNKR